MRTLGHQVDVDVAQHRREAIRVLLLPAFGAAAEAQTVGALAVALALDQSFEEPGAMTTEQFGDGLAGGGVDRLSGLGARAEVPYRNAAGGGDTGRVPV